jgi:hypothetical protein
VIIKADGILIEPPVSVLALANVHQTEQMELSAGMQLIRLW